MFQFKHLLERFNELGPWQRLALSIDILLLFLVAIDLFWMVGDLFLIQLANSSLDKYLFEIPSQYKAHGHPYFLTFDTLVISIFIVEFFTRWFFALYYKTYPKWFFYPLAHWYNALGSLPSSSFRLVHVFRIVGLAYRLQKWRVTDFRTYYVVGRAIHYYEVLMEEVSDRVAVKILKEVKSEFQREPPLSEQIIDEVLYPKKPIIAEWLSRSIQVTLRDTYAYHRKDWQSYLKTTVEKAMNDRPELAQLQKIPMLGNYFTDTLKQAVAGVVVGVIDQITQDVYNKTQQTIITQCADDLLETLLQDQDRLLQELSNQIAAEVIDSVIERVKEKKWQQTPPPNK